MHKLSCKMVVAALFIVSLSVSAEMLVGELQGDIAVNNLGAMSYTIPLDVSPGTAGMEPKLAISYSSRGGNGPLGIGFSLSGLSAITRAGASLDQDGFIDGVDFDENDRFLLDGQRLELVSAEPVEYGDANSEYRTEIDSFSRVIAYGQAGGGPEWFKVWTKSGLIYEYGNTADSSFFPGSPADVLSWQVNKVSDTSGNYMLFTYEETTAGPRISRIDYTGNSAVSLSTYNSVEFDYTEDRPDPVVSYFMGTEMLQNKRLSTITMKHLSNELHHYSLIYDTSESGLSILDSVQQYYGENESVADKLPKIKFDYSGNSEANAFAYQDGYPVFSKDGERLTSFIGSGDASIQGDFNGDGLMDVCSVGDGRAGWATETRWVGLSNGDGTFDFTVGTAFLPGNLQTQVGTGGHTVHARDFNNDGLTDICSIGDQLGTGYNSVWIGISDGDGTFTFTVGTDFIPSNLEVDTFADDVSKGVVVADFNGDGYADIFSMGDLPEQRWLGINNGQGVFDFTGRTGYLIIPEDYDCRFFGGASVIRTGDFNGDGRVDICSLGDNAGTQNDDELCWVGLSTADGHFIFKSGTDVLLSGLATRENYTYPDGGDGQNVITHYNGAFITADDYNGDGLTDICSIGSSMAYVSGETCWLGLSNGDGTFDFSGRTGTNFFPTADLECYIQASAAGCLISSGDFNGDGLPDLYSIGKEQGTSQLDQKKCWVGLSRGNGSFEFIEQKALLPSNYTAYPSGQYEGAHLFTQDFNGDGHSDVLCIGPDGNNDGKDRTWFGYSNGDGTFTYQISPQLREAYPAGHHYSVADFNGDGMLDIFGVPSSSSYWMDYSDYSWVGINQNESVRLTSVAQGYQSETVHGVVTDVEYSSLAGNLDVYVKGVGATYPVRDVISSMHVVSRLVKDNGQGGTYPTDYTYEGARQHLHGRGFLGFHKFESYDSHTKLSVIEQLAQDFPFTGNTLQTQTLYIPDPGVDTDDPNYSQLISQVDKDWICDLVAGGTLFAFNPRSVETRYELDEPGDIPYATVTTLNWYDTQSQSVAPPTTQPLILNSEITHGNLVKSEVDYGGGLKQTVVNTYDDLTDATHWLLGRLDTSLVTHEDTGKPDVVRSTAFDYYADPAHASYGLLAQEVLEPGNPAFELVADYYYDDFGNVERKAITGSGIPTRNVEYNDYDTKGRFVDETRNGENHATTFVFDQAIGKPTSSSDPNTLPTSWAYDPAGRNERAVMSDGTVTNITYSWDAISVTVPDGPGSAGTITHTSIYKRHTDVYKNIADADAGINGSAPVTVWFDKLGREIRTQIRSADGSLVNRDSGFNAIAQPICVSDPYFVSGGTAVYTYTQYDELGRPQYVTAPDGTVSELEYNGLTTRAIADSDHRQTGLPAAKNQVTTTVKNARGDTLSVTDAMPTPNTINYTYDAAGNLTHTVDPDANTIEIEYDVRGNKMRQDDPDMGEWHYTYNALDQLMVQVDANGNRIEYGYDMLGRPETRTNWVMKAGAQNLELEGIARWYYDGAGEGAKLGMLRREEHRDGNGRFINRKTFAYDEYCRPMFELRNYDAKWYYTTLRYDAFSRVEYVDRFWRPVGKEGPAYQLDTEWQSVATKNTYNQYGALLSVTDPSDSSVWWSCDADDYDQQGRLTEYLYGNGLKTFTEYDAQTGLIEGLDIKTGGWTLSDYGFGYDRLGNMTSRVHTRPFTMPTLTENCTYDSLNRLGSGTVTGPVNFSTDATYDALGNIQTRTGITGTYAYYANRPHAVYTAGDCTYYYDANGNVVRRDDNSQYEFTANWNSFNKPSSVFSGPEGSEFEYDVNGKRTKQLIFENGTVRKKIYVAETYEIEEVLSNPTQSDRSLWVWTPVHSRIYINTPAGRVGIYQKAASSNGSGTVTKSWLHKDHLGSVIAISDINQSITYQSYDAWGNRRDASDWSSIAQSEISNHQSAMTDRGYTGHEMLSHLDLVHMNGRIYDPVIGRFISPDPIIQSPHNLQSYNRYSYVMNRPLSMTDPSGFIAGLLLAPMAAITSASSLVSTISSWSTAQQDSTGGGTNEGHESSFTTQYYLDGNGNLQYSTYYGGNLISSSPAASEKFTPHAQLEDSSCLAASVRNAIEYLTGKDIPEKELKELIDSILTKKGIFLEGHVHDWATVGMFPPWTEAVLPEIAEKYGLVLGPMHRVLEDGDPDGGANASRQATRAAMLNSVDEDTVLILCTRGHVRMMGPSQESGTILRYDPNSGKTDGSEKPGITDKHDIRQLTEYLGKANSQYYLLKRGK